METYSVLTDWKSIVKMSILPKEIYSLQIQWNLYKNSSVIFHRNRENNPKICMEPQKTLNSQSNLEKEEEQSWTHSLISKYIAELQ